MGKDIWIILELEGQKISPKSLMLIGEAKRLLELLQEEGSISTIAFGLSGKKIQDELGPYGVDNIFYSQQNRIYDPEIFVPIISDLAEFYEPFMVMLLSSAFGNDLGARLAAKIGAGFVSGCVDFRKDTVGNLTIIKPIYQGMLYGHWLFRRTSMGIVTIIPEILDPLTPTFESCPSLIKMRSINEYGIRKLIIKEHLRGDPKTIDLSEAEKIVVAGRGVLNEKEGFSLTKQLAETLGAAIGGTRPLIDQGVLPYERQIGQTGKNVAPKLIITCGVSGAFEFTVGMDKSDQVIAINTDPNARIFNYSDLGIVADVKEFLPILIHGIQVIRKAES